MARVALIKVFTGLNLGVCQLAGELRRAGHETLIVYFKDYVVAPETDGAAYERSDYCGTWIAARGKEMNCNFFKPFTAREFDLLAEALREFRPDLIGLSLCSVPLRQVAEVTRQVRERFTVPIVWGGSGPTLEPEKCLEHADMVCVGEGEEAIVELAARIDAGADLAGVGSVWTRRDGAIVRGPDRPLLDIDTIAFPDFDEARAVHISDDRLARNVYPHHLGRQYHIMTQRGCPYSCSFCIESHYQEAFGKKDSLRRRSVDLVIEELVQAKRKHDVEAVMFYDDVFTVNRRWLREFAPRYKAEVGLPFWCYTYPRTTYADDLRMLKDAGLASVTIGIQSGSEQVLRAYDRPVARKNAIDAARTIVATGLVGFFDLITMSEFETEETCRETLEFLLDFPREMKTVGFYPMIQFPGYGYTRKVEAEGRAVTLGADDYAYFHRLYLLTRTRVPRRVVRALARSRLVRWNPRVLDPLLPKTLPFFYLDNGALNLHDATLATLDARGRTRTRSLAVRAAA